MDNTAPLIVGEAERPLLPPFLLSPASFLWLWVLPAGLLLALNVQGYRLVEGNMDATQHQQASLLGLTGLASIVGGLFLHGYARRQGRVAHPLWGVPAVLMQVLYLWLAISSLGGDMLPASVTVWIYPPQRFLFNQFAFAMVPLFHGVLQIACARPASPTFRSLAVNLGLAVVGPVLLYLFFAAARFFYSSHHPVNVVLVAAGVIVLGIVMFIGLVRALMLGLRVAWRRPVAGERWAIIMLAFVLPVGGLLLNINIPFPVNFQAWEVYALVAANTVILLTASAQHSTRPALSFGLLCGTLPFSLYFFVVFLPYTPLSILAIIVLGVGFLVLAPTLLFTLHLHLLNKAWRNPLMAARRPRFVAVGLACSLVLPAFFTLRGLADKAALNAALDHVYTPALNRPDITYPGSLGNLRRALHSHRAYKNGIYYPLLSDYYAWLVFDDLVLSDDKLAQVETVFFGPAVAKQSAKPPNGDFALFGTGRPRDRQRMPRTAPVARTVEVSNLESRVGEADGKNTRLTLVLTLSNTGSGMAEYQQALPLPAGVLVCGFRLHIDGRAVPGRIFEKKTALWVYTMIRDSERRDPGLLFYRTPTELELRVYPVNAGTPATVEIDFLVPGKLAPDLLAADAKDPAQTLARLPAMLSPQLTADGRGNVAATGLESLQLPLVEREPYLHVIVDRSLENGFGGDVVAALEALRPRFPAVAQVRVTLANYSVLDLVPSLTPWDALPPCGPAELRRTLPLGGGFSADLALAHAVRQHGLHDLDRAAAAGPVPLRPVFVILSRTAAPRQLDIPITEAWADILPGLEVCEYGGDATFVTHTTGGAAAPLLRVGRSQRPLAAGQVTRFIAREDDPLEYWAPTANAWQRIRSVVAQSATTRWSQAVALQLRQQDQARSPGDADVDLRRLVQASRESGILLRSTSYIVVENEAQWRKLALAEKQKLGQNTALEFLETPAPPALWVGLGFALWLGLRRWREGRLRPVCG